ncbi:MAG: hypothetical protein GTN67_00915 [Hydrotalea flava]|uniref:heavy metal-binding domain-containing protein n=1 Tax=Hydrotalea TaxID=1004300 RepID=UPI00102735DF|nr:MULTISPECIES: heavy metal-binding domain-containing protein [Hydrotalea]NIM34062.1 hypothetical protein [Hydrotalea flava]NIM36886.1 hypothetical protein [Hydrotalea flava]NIN02077.1 hypothetical protein [Hydrotalea flava]NIN13730.1 hypothetical protein [Hydrotalea flava]NIO92812.1 hypothetical protein [Hydrotalea flava]
MKTKKMILMMLALTVFIFAGVPVIGQNKSVVDTTQPGTVIYTCTMHPEIQSKQPGTCPKCGMELVKKSEASEKKHKKHKMKMMCPMMKGMSNVSNMSPDKSGENMENNKITNDSAQFSKLTLKEKKHKMSSMGIGMGIMMAGMLVFLISR